MEKKIKLSIKNRWTGSIIFEYEKENNTIAETVKEYIRQEIEVKEKWRANLTRADLTRANLTRANLTDANLTDANLTDANLTDADLTDADLTRANLTDANLTRANLTRADLTRADLTDADLTDANLTRADLTRANLTRANLTDADLTAFKNDIWAILLRSNETAFLLKALKEGRVDGSVYEGECCCLVGTIAKSKGCYYKESEKLNGLIPDGSRPAERWFMQISKGKTPENSGVVKLTVEWVEEFMGLMEYQRNLKTK